MGILLSALVEGGALPKELVEFMHVSWFGGPNAMIKVRACIRGFAIHSNPPPAIECTDFTPVVGSGNPAVRITKHQLALFGVLTM